jgi:DNA-binding CsgD family transcriptional regulator
VQSAYLALATGDPAAARAHLDAVPQGTWGLHWYVARAGPLRAEIAVLDGDVAAASAAIEEVIAAAGTQRPWARSLAMIARARLLHQGGSLPQATAAAHDALSTLIRIGHRPDALDALELLAQIGASSGRMEEAARLFGAAGGARDRFGLRRAPVYDRAMAATTAAFEETHGLPWALLAEEGAAMSLEDALAYASRGRGGRRRPTAGWQSLTPAESRVAELVAAGLSNVEIGGRLFISPATVRAHLGHIYTKLGVGSRAALVVEVRRSTTGAESS